MSHIRTNLRGCQDWVDFGYPLSTTSDEASKLYDAALSQIVGWYEDTNLGGLTNTTTKMLEADPEFVMGHVLTTSLKLIGTVFISPDDPIREEVTKVEQIAANQTLTDIEKKHMEALRKLLDANLSGAIALWDEILHLNPLDILAIRHLFFGCFFLGRYEHSRDVFGRILSIWKPTMPLYGYFLGEYAFTLQENYLFQRAEQDGFKALEMNRHDIFAAHAISHVYEMQGRVSEGIKLIEERENDWKVCTHFDCHMYWHNSLYYVEKGQYEEALGIFDSEIVTRYKESKSWAQLVDASSLLYRLGLEGVPVGERWQDLYETCKDGVENHSNLYIDPHVMMTCLGSKETDAASRCLESFRESVSKGHGHSKGISEHVIIPLCEALMAHDSGDHSRVVDLAYPIRYDLIKTGGSNAQRDVFNLLLIDSALKSDKKEHRNFGRHLLVERKAFKENSPMTDRMMEKLLASHAE